MLQVASAFALLQSCSSLALWGRFDTMISENAFYGVSVHGDPKIVQGIPDPGVSPGRILGRDSDRQIGNSVPKHGSPGTSFGRPVVFPGDKVPEPAQKRIGRDNPSVFLESFPSQYSGLHGQSTPLPVRKSEPTAFEMFLIHPDLFDEIVDDLLLIPVDPACSNEDDESQIVRHGVEDTRISRGKAVNRRT